MVGNFYLEPKIQELFIVKMPKHMKNTSSIQSGGFMSGGAGGALSTAHDVIGAVLNHVVL